MTTIVGVRFKDSSKTYYFDPRDLELHQGDIVIVDTVRGPEMAKVAHGKRDIPEAEVVGELKPVIRRASETDFEYMHRLHSKHADALACCAEKVVAHNLPMKLIKSEYSFDGSRLTFYFIAEQRVDFRMLVRDLAHTFKTRIELRQVGPRDEARLLGGVGPCGRELCCATFLPSYAVVNIKMAKDQDLPLNPSKISGLCGRLLCCLSYEHQHYVTLRSQLPTRGTQVTTPDGRGEVVSINALQQMVTVRLTSSGMEETYSITHLYTVDDESERKSGRRTARDTGEQAASRVLDDAQPQPSQKYRAHADAEYAGIDDSDVLEALALLEEGAMGEYGTEREPGSASERQSSSRQRAKRSRSRSSSRPKQREAGTPEADESADTRKSKAASARSRRHNTAKRTSQQPDTQQSTDQSPSSSSSQKVRSRRSRRKRPPE